MPSARPSAFKGASGILRDVDGTITGIRFTDKNPLAGKGTPKPGQKKSDFHSLFAVVNIKVDGAVASSEQPIFVGNADDFGVTEDQMGLTGDGQLSKSSGWFIFLNSLINPGGTPGGGFDETNFPDDDPNVADYSAIVGARCRFNWQVNEKATKKYGKKVSSKDPKKTYDREDLIVTNYYGQVEVEEEQPADAKPGLRSNTPPKSDAKPLGAGKGNKGKTVDVAKITTEAIILAVAASKDKKMTKSKVSVKLLTAMGDQTPELRSAVRDWAENNDNLASIEGLDFDKTTETLSLSAD